MRFFLFAGNDYYPKGGMVDLQAIRPTAKEALEALDPGLYHYKGGWAHIFDAEKMEVAYWLKDGKWSGSSGEFDEKWIRLLLQAKLEAHPTAPPPGDRLREP